MSDYTDEFEIFWRGYPRRWNNNLSMYVKRKKYPAFESWQKLSQEIRAKCLRIVKQIKKAEGTPRDAVTWINQRGWDDIDEPDKDAQRLPQSLVSGMKSVPEPRVNTNNECNKQIDLLREN